MRLGVWCQMFFCVVKKPLNKGFFEEIHIYDVLISDGALQSVHVLQLSQEQSQVPPLGHGHVPIHPQVCLPIEYEPGPAKAIPREAKKSIIVRRGSA